MHIYTYVQYISADIQTAQVPFPEFLKASDDHSAFAICTIQRDVFNLRVVAQYIGQKDKEKGATKNDALDAQS